ncbi:MAG: Gfo/Idh/MocA family oxidoreductase, partial [Draconibacterium sp.]|nr:Gfo/Idh/MocA family oxidoreductase [Draconibacterium sp.]
MNRKEFITDVTLAGAAAIISPAVAHAGLFRIKQNKKVKVGVIGCGSVSGVYLPHLSKTAFVEIISVCDIKPERAKERAEQFNVPVYYPHIDEMLSGKSFDLMI